MNTSKLTLIVVFFLVFIIGYPTNIYAQEFEYNTFLKEDINKRKMSFNIINTIDTLNIDEIFIPNTIHERRRLYRKTNNKYELQSPSSTNLLLDSTYLFIYNQNGDSVPYRKFIYTYDENGYLKQDIYYYFDSINNTWIIVDKYEYEYNSSNKLISESYLIWSDNLNKWEGRIRDEYDYDTEGFINLHINYWKVDINNEWIKYDKYEYINDKNGKPLLSNRSKWDESEGLFIPNLKDDYEYYANGKLKVHISSKWWQDSLRYRYLYKKEVFLDKNLNDSLSIKYEWDGRQIRWRFYIKEEVVYNPTTNDSTTIVYFYRNYRWVFSSKKIKSFKKDNFDVSYEHFSYYYSDTDSAQWFGNVKKETNFEPNGDKSLEIIYDWEPTLRQWTKYLKMKFIYNSNETLKEENDYYFDTLSNDWICDWKDIFTYDNLGNETILVSLFLNKSTNEWYVNKRFKYYSSHIIDIIRNDISSQVRIYPNPFRNSVNIEIPFDQSNICLLYNCKGQLIKELEIDSDNIKTNTINLNNGAYFLIIVTPSGTIIKKLIKI